MSRRDPVPSTKRDRRDDIVQASLKLFAEKGFHGTSMRDIARAADITEGLIYHYFANKRDLFTAIIEEHSFLPLLRSLPDLGEWLDTRELLLVLARGFFDVLHRNEDLTRLLLQEVQVFPEEKEAFFADAVKESVGALGKVLEDRMSERARTQVDPEVMARIFFNSLLAFFVEQEILGGKNIYPGDEQAYVEHLVDMLVKRIGASRGRPSPKLSAM